MIFEECMDFAAAFLYPYRRGCFKPEEGQQVVRLASELQDIRSGGNKIIV